MKHTTFDGGCNWPESRTAIDAKRVCSPHETHRKTSIYCSHHRSDPVRSWLEHRRGTLGWLRSVRQTISDLAAYESPVQLVMSSFFILGGVLTLIASIYARTFAFPGRVVLFIAAIRTFGLTIFPTPLIGYSIWHRVFAISSFVFLIVSFLVFFFAVLKRFIPLLTISFSILELDFLLTCFFTGFCVCVFMMINFKYINKFCFFKYFVKICYLF